MRLGTADAPQPAGATEAATAQHDAVASDIPNETPAAEHFTVSRRRGAEPSPVQLVQDHASLLRDAYEFFSQRSEDEPLLSPAAEWLLDNFYMVQEALRQVREDLPDQYYSELPKLDEGPLKDYPRVYALMREAVKDGDALVDMAQVVSFVQRYQETTEALRRRPNPT